MSDINATAPAEAELRRELGLPMRRPLQYKRLTPRGVQAFPVASFRVIARATRPAAYQLDVVLGNGAEHTVLASFFASMQDPMFGLDGRER